ncbi:hypothetical protein [Enterobacter cloacae]|uniref:hypothetical protein n=1 Tax=Enterobacter cloacae TaxID=550 RepID=UPI002A82DEB3|nr:hypothetical protein [Enterobacter cloacae]
MITKKTNKKSLRATLARAKRQNYEKVVIRVSLMEELLDQMDALENLNVALAAEVNDLKHPGTYLPSKRATPAADSVLAELRSQVIRNALNECTEYLDRDCIMDSNGISYEDAALREAGAMALHDVLLRQERVV